MILPRGEDETSAGWILGHQTMQRILKEEPSFTQESVFIDAIVTGLSSLINRHDLPLTHEDENILMTGDEPATQTE